MLIQLQSLFVLDVMIMKKVLRYLYSCAIYNVLIYIFNR